MRKNLSLRRQPLVDLATDELVLVAAGLAPTDGCTTGATETVTETATRTFTRTVTGVSHIEIGSDGCM